MWYSEAQWGLLRRDKIDAKIWFYSLPKEIITTWDEMASTLLAKYLPPTKVSKLWSDIMTFAELDESIHDAWERYKVLLNKASNHVLTLWLEIQFFYNGLYPNTKIIDAVASRALMSTRELLDEMLSNHYQWQSTKGQQRSHGYMSSMFYPLSKHN